MKKHKFYSVLFISDLVVLLPLLCYYRQHFSVDAYGIMVEGLNGMSITFISSFRFTGALLIRFLSLINHNPLLNPTVDIIFYIIAVAVCITVNTAVICSKLEKHDFLTATAIDLAVLLSVDNVWFCDLLTFSECIFITAVGLLACTCALTVFVLGKKALRYPVSGLLLIFSIGVYQQFITVFAVYIIAIVSIDVAKNKEISFSKIIKAYLIPALLIVISGLLYFVIAKSIISAFGLTPNERAAFSTELLFDNIKYFISHQHSFLKGRGYFETEILTLSYVIFGALWLIAVASDYVKNKKTLRTVFLILSCAAGYICSYTLGLITTSHATRTMFGLFSVFVIFSSGIFALTKNRAAIYITTVILLVLVSVNTVKTVCVSNREIETNRKDSEYVSAIYEKIENYEDKEKTEVKNIAFCSDKQHDFTYNTDVYTDYAFRAMLSLKNKDNGREAFSFAEMPKKVYSTYFEKENMCEFCAEKQMIFDGDTLYLCIY